ncbi:MAG: hypothetical protein CMG52_02435 [Candidatus Marinimicrobia bacterium]|nr:hypothetical protein [Candidatus Neomarinimicrobiota bacterium]MCS5651417.1 hypothetical protein [Candidatus Neomarinimicrobiota bacterium]
MVIGRTFVKLLRWGLRFHSVFHVLEFVSALIETAYVTAGLAFFAGAIEVLASFLLPHEHVHFKGLIPTVHEECDDSDQDP